MLYRRGDQSQAQAEDYVADYNRLHSGLPIETEDIDTPGGQDKSQLYGVVRCPAILALSDDGALLEMWQGEHLPLMKELDFYSQN